ncbi:MAG: dephospho-CoA kinase [Gemmatimonadetes bacterium]|nr:dephospho-CoA kinase [Gemmatimonadota bacterium]
MRIIGLTGNIASGKSSVARLLAERGIPVIDDDVLAREAVAPGSPALARIVERFGLEALAPDGTLDRTALRRRVFGAPLELDALNAIVHPAVGRLRDVALDRQRAAGAPVVVCDIPLLFEAGLTGSVDTILLVDAPRDVRLDRLVRDRGLAPAEAMQMIAAQMPAELKRARADVVIDNDGSREDLAARVDAAWRALQSA